MCRSEIVIATPSRDESTASLVDGLANIVTSCYGDRIEVGLIGRRHDDLARELSQHFIPVALIDPSKIYSNTVKSQFHHKLHVFVVDGNFAFNFKQLINLKLKLAISWNHMASFFLIDRSPDCHDALRYLYEAWDDDLLNAKVFCHHLQHGPVIFTYNPFTSDAPAPWQRIFVGTFRKHPFTLLVREYSRNAAICVNLDFEKTKDLGGYPITVRGEPLGAEERVTLGPRAKQFWRRHDRILNTLSHTLNARLIFINSGYFEDIEKQFKRMTTQAYGHETTYPHAQHGLIIVTQFRGHKSQLNKILFVIDVDSRIGLGIVYLITLIFLKFFVRQALLPALLNLGIYQGNLAALLTQQIALRQVNTMQDVAEFGYKLYGHGDVPNLLDQLELKIYFTSVEDRDKCFEHVMNDSSAACLWPGDGGVFDTAREFDLHLSSEFVAMDHSTFGIRLNWPLQRRIDLTIKKMVEADILEPWNDKCNPTKLSDYQIDMEVRNNKSFKKIELGELAFAFVILGIGLLCATITFIVELAIQYKCIFVDRQIIN